MGCNTSINKSKVLVAFPLKKNCNDFLKDGIKLEHLDFHIATSISSGGFGDVLQISMKLDKKKSLAVKVSNVNGEYCIKIPKIS